MEKAQKWLDRQSPKKAWQVQLRHNFGLKIKIQSQKGLTVIIEKTESWWFLSFISSHHPWNGPDCLPKQVTLVIPMTCLFSNYRGKNITMITITIFCVYKYKISRPASPILLLAVNTRRLLWMKTQGCNSNHSTSSSKTCSGYVRSQLLQWPLAACNLPVITRGLLTQKLKSRVCYSSAWIMYIHASRCWR